MKELIPSTSQERLRSIGAYAHKLGLKAWVVGGAVRDSYLGKTTEDMDLTFNGNQESVAGFCVRAWKGEKHRFSKFGTFSVQLGDGFKLDLARLRKENYPFPGSLPEVSFTTNLKEDLFRRDFTINAWAVSILPDTFGKSCDSYGAKKDIDRGLIRVLHEKSFLDDPTRMFRAVRFAGRFGWKLAPKTEQLLRQGVEAQYPLLVSRDRFSRELIKILEEDTVRPIFSLMGKYDLLKFAWPNLSYHPAIDKTKDADLRLGILVLSLKEKGEDFLRSLRIPKYLSHEIHGAWRIQQDEMAPLGKISSYQETLLQLMHPALPSAALTPCFVHGKELQGLGLFGRRISGALHRVRRAQWKGEVSCREEALKLLEC